MTARVPRLDPPMPMMTSVVARMSASGISGLLSSQGSESEACAVEYGSTDSCFRASEIFMRAESRSGCREEE